MFGDFARNVSHYPDISDLYLVADVLVTDYSSVMFDFVNTGRPMLFFTHDLEAYRDDLRGSTSTSRPRPRDRCSPTPTTSSTPSVTSAGWSPSTPRRYEAFRQKFASLEDGHAAARFVDQLLTDSS